VPSLKGLLILDAAYPAFRFAPRWAKLFRAYGAVFFAGCSALQTSIDLRRTLSVLMLLAPYCNSNLEGTRPPGRHNRGTES